jgi:tRNA threonylcarbamoyladenosine biosynthesis protein TsaB
VLVLALDTSSAAVTAAVVELPPYGDSGPDVRQAERVTRNARGHGEHLAPAVAACLADVGAAPGDLGAVVTAAVLGATLGIPTYGVCSLDAIAGATSADGPLLVAADARRKEVYWARYVDGVRVTGPEVSRPADVPLGARAAAGAGARLYADVLGLALVGPDYPSATALVQAAADRIRAGAPSEPLTPLYLRRPDAVPPGRPKAVTP